MKHGFYLYHLKTETLIMYYIDSANQEVVQFNYDPDTGHISNEESVYRFKESDGLPNGITIDQEGMLYVALFKGGDSGKN